MNSPYKFTDPLGLQAKCQGPGGGQTSSCDGNDSNGAPLRSDCPPDKQCYREDGDGPGIERFIDENGEEAITGDSPENANPVNPFTVLKREESEPSFFAPQDIRSHTWFFLRGGLFPLYTGAEIAKQVTAAPILQTMADRTDFGADPGRQFKHCWVSCVATGLSFGDSSTIAVFGTAQEIVTTLTFWRSPERKIYWVDSKLDMEANRRDQRLCNNFYVGGCKEACMNQSP